MRNKAIFNRFIPLLLLLVISLKLKAEPLSLDDIIQEAIKNNPELLTNKKNIDLAQSDVISAGLKQNPSLNIVADILPVPGQGFNPLNKTYGANFNLPLDIHHRIKSRTQLSEFMLTSSKNLYLDNIRQLKLQLKTAYYTALALRDKLELVNKNLESLSAFVEMDKIRLKNNDIPEIDLTRAEFVRDQYKNDLEAAQVAYFESLVDLQNLMGRKQLSDTLELQSDIENITPPDSLSLDNAMTLAVTNRNDLAALKNILDADKANQTIQESFKHPDLAIQFDCSAQQDSYFWGMTFNILLPLYNKNQGEIAKSQVKVDQDELAIQSLAHSMKAEIKKAIEEMNNSWSVVQSHKNVLIPKSTEILKTVEYSYKSGNTSILDYFDAQRAFNETMNNYIDNLLRYHINQSIFLSALSKD